MNHTNAKATEADLTVNERADTDRLEALPGFSTSAASGRKLVMILLGPPGAGKGTQCRRIAKSLGIPVISSGDILRTNLRACTELGLRAKDAMDRGALVSDELIFAMLRSRLLESDCGSGFLLDGIPRTVRQAEFLDAQLMQLYGKKLGPPLIIDLEVEDVVILNRLAGRRVCGACGATYNLATRPPWREGQCDFDGAQLITRDDDQSDVWKRRLSDYRESALAIRQYFASRYGTVIAIDASRPIEDVSTDILARMFIDIFERS